MDMEEFYSENSAQMFSSGSEEDNYTSNLSCIASSFQDVHEFTLPDSVAIPARLILILYGLSLMFFGTLLNGLILFLVARYKKLRTASFGIAVQLAVVNIILSSLGYGIPSIVNHAAGYWILGSNFCIASAFTLTLLIILRILLVFAFSLDRFSFVYFPFSYPKHNGKVLIIMCILAWFLCISLNVMSVPPFLDCFKFKEEALTCIYSPECNTNCQILFYTFFIVFIIPAILISTGLFLALYLKGRKMRAQIRMLGAPTSATDEQEWRAIRTLLILFAASFVVSVPPTILLNVSDQLQSGSVVRILFKILGKNGLLLLVITDPVIILRNGDIKEIIEGIVRSFRDRRAPSNQRENGGRPLSN